MTSATGTKADYAGTRQPFDLSDELSAQVDANGMREHVDHIREEGYAIIPLDADPVGIFE